MLAAAIALALVQPAASLFPPPRAAEQMPDIVTAVAASGLPSFADGDAFRFTDIAPGGRIATIYDARRTAAGTTRTILGLTATPQGWHVDSRETQRLATETFDYLAARIDAALAKPAPAAPACPDDSDYLSERARDGTVRSLHGCGTDHPNTALARLFGVRETP